MIHYDIYEHMYNYMHHHHIDTCPFLIVLFAYIPPLIRIPRIKIFLYFIPFIIFDQFCKYCYIWSEMSVLYLSTIVCISNVYEVIDDYSCSICYVHTIR